MLLTSRGRARIARATGPAGDAGFTINELLIVIVLIGLIVGPMTAVMIGIFRYTDTTTNRLAENSDAELAAAYFVQDVQSIGVRNWFDPPTYPHKQSVELDVRANAGLYPCGTGTERALFRFAWENPLGEFAPTEPRVAYVLRDVGAERELHRIACDGAGKVTADIVLARHVDDTTNPVVSCRGPAGTTIDCESVPLPITVTLTLTLRSPSSGSVYPVTLIGQRRQM
jgi:hypothetical protein